MYFVARVKNGQRELLVAGDVAIQTGQRWTTELEIAQPFSKKDTALTLAACDVSHREGYDMHVVTYEESISEKVAEDPNSAETLLRKLMDTVLNGKL